MYDRAASWAREFAQWLEKIKFNNRLSLCGILCSNLTLQKRSFATRQLSFGVVRNTIRITLILPFQVPWMLKVLRSRSSSRGSSDHCPRV